MAIPRQTVSDVASVRGIDRLAFAANEQYTPEYYHRVASSEDDFKPVVATMADGRIVGWALVDLGCHPIRLRSISVHPDFHRRGVGTELLQAVLERHAPVDLLVEPDNVAGLAFYARFGFRVAEPDPEMPARIRLLWQPDGATGPSSTSKGKGVPGPGLAETPGPRDGNVL